MSTLVGTVDLLTGETITEDVDLNQGGAGVCAPVIDIVDLGNMTPPVTAADRVVMELPELFILVTSVSPSEDNFPAVTQEYAPGVVIPNSVIDSTWSFLPFWTGNPSLNYYFDSSTLVAPCGWPDLFPDYEIVNAIIPPPSENAPFSSSTTVDAFFSGSTSQAQAQAYYDSQSADDQQYLALFSKNQSSPDGFVYRYGARVGEVGFFPNVIGLSTYGPNPPESENGVVRVNVADVSRSYAAVISFVNTSEVSLARNSDWNFQSGHTPPPVIKLFGYQGGTYSVDGTTNKIVNTGGTLVWTQTITLAAWPPTLTENTPLGTFTPTGFTPA